jgi:serine/threonine protein kinase
MSGSALQGGDPSRKAVVGDSIGGFTIVRQLGVGGMGETWEAVRRVGPDFEQRVAVKLGNPDLLRHSEGRDLLRREASLAASLRHPNIASVLDWNEELGYIICELVEGADFRAVLREAPSGRLAAPQLVLVMSQIARGLSHAHRRLLQGIPSPVIHRDMSPGNVVVDYDGNVKIVDFGIAKVMGSSEGSQSIKGKLAYMAPEQATGAALDGRVDQYALGVMAYEAATAVRPNDGAHDGETLAKILEGDHIPVGRRAPSIPSGLAEIIERMLSVRPDDRFPSMDAVIDALEPLTPSLTIHRSLAALVYKAHPPHTIIEEGGRFVSRPVVSFELPSSELSAAVFGLFPQTPSRVRAVADDQVHHRTPWARSGSRPSDPHRARPASIHDSAAPPRERQPSPWPTFAVGSGVAGVFALVTWLVFAPKNQAPERTDVQAAVAAPAGEHLPPAARPPEPPPAQPERTQLTANDLSAAGNAGADAKAAVVPPSEPGAPQPVPRPRRGGASKRQQAASDEVLTQATPTGSATLRVKVFPWGRVWIDGKVRGSVPPILETKIDPGSHTIGVGHETPTQSRNITVSAGESQLIAFDLEGW